jgi:hypothetical protein
LRRWKSQKRPEVGLKSSLREDLDRRDKRGRHNDNDPKRRKEDDEAICGTMDLKGYWAGRTTWMSLKREES